MVSKDLTRTQALEADLMLAKTALAETMKLFNNQPTDSGLRDHFASLAMQGLIAADVRVVWDNESIADLAYDQADAMLERREKKR